MNMVTLDTYPDSFTDTGDFIANSDRGVRMFAVPLTWLADYVAKVWGITLDDYFKTCTWDDNWQLYEMAKQKGLLVSERIEKREIAL